MSAARRRGGGGGAAADLAAAAPPWLLARLIVVGGYVAAAVAADRLRAGRPRPIQLRQGLFAWDGAWYRDIAAKGYDALPHEALRFFPLFPLLGRAVSVLALGRTGFGLVVVANVAALAAGVLLYRLVTHETGDRVAARRAAWLLALAPPAFVLAFAYAEALYLVCAIGVFLALRRKQWWWAAVLGAAAGATRPLGVALVLPAMIEVLCDGRPTLRSADGAGRVAAVVGPGVGLGAFLLWAGSFAPLRVQEQLRGDLVDPFTRIGRSISDLFGSQRLGDGLHAPFALALVLLVVACFWLLPASYGAYSAVVVAVALAAGNLNSLERYGLNAFPLVIALALLVRRPLAEQVTVVLSGAMLAALCALAWVGAYVP